MTPRTVAILMLCAIVSVGAAVYGGTQRVNFEDSNFEGQRLFPELLDKAGSVAEIAITQNGKTMTFDMKDGKWSLRESDGYPVHGNLPAKVIFSLANMELLEQKTAIPARFEKLQLRDPSDSESKAQKVVMKDAGGTVLAELIVGRANTFLPTTTAGGMYVRRPGEDQAWLVRGLVDIGVEPRDWLQRDIVDIKPERIAHVEVTQPDGEKLIVEPSKDAKGEFAFANMPAGMVLKSEYAPRNIAALLGGFVLNDVRRSEHVQLDPAEAYVSDFTSTDGISVELRIWSKDESQYMTVEASYIGSDPASDAAKQASGIAARTQGWTYIIPEYQYQQVAKKMSDMIEKPKPAS